MKREERRRWEFPPDFAHGEVMLGEAYDVLGARWLEQAIFVSRFQDELLGEIVTAGRFDDYFLTVEQWVEGDEEPLESWWTSRARGRSRSVGLSTGGEGEPLAELVIEVHPARLRELEQGVLGVTREGASADESRFSRRRRAHIDLLSLIALTTRLSDRAAAA
ncbi:hypothetical protein DL240_06100 [Lujinxingia litoralis]|uniref:Uncharacterized protein n=1 Tax=Lujinxingia litoralis TaxID=2211119 RepID=A0A328CC42_9DELT|nr:hypothetical protein [Lujinxingia litoralis]RAL23727.1 hypothetical protein DL240_06100 [Lujinxingia litoralis]